MKRKITIYKNLNEPYEAMLQRGLQETPDECFVRFFEERAKFRAFMGIKKSLKREIIIRKVSWI
ncbi:hypothetical protein [Runella salmonicolor]|uniref:Uncharacterized protein n=1 Tax=Runella salmonicolor TaxID=2950278 RepID=A0ABT1FMI5_9BACT|nr:hypothetical protein [Runella salmonicolor]MCP1382975.1 hypothetical protein [Runella salmonicolor]